MPKTLLLMCGPSGAGKSYWVKEFMSNCSCNTPVVYVSRDAIRFSKLHEGEDYFSHEDEVFKEFIDSIQKHLNTMPDKSFIIADATHLNEFSRNKTLDALHIPEGIDIIPVSINPGIKKCLENNEKRVGLAYVPPSVIRRMYNNFTIPCNTEKYKYKAVWYIGKVGVRG